VPVTAMLALDHIMISVDSHRDAILELTRLGFLHREVRPLAPMGGGHAGGIGGSAVVMLQSATPGAANYLELSYLDAPFAAPFMKPILGERPRAAMLVHATDDARALHARWSRDGVAVLPMLEIALAPSSVSAGQKLRLLLPTENPPIWCNACQYESTAEFQVPRLTRHPNTAQRWTGVVVVTPTALLTLTLDHFARVYDQRPHDTSWGHQFRPEGGVVNVTTPERASAYPAGIQFPERLALPRIIAIHIAVADIQVLGESLLSAGLQPLTKEGYMATPVLRELGTQLLFSNIGHDTAKQ
jgi:hypothetical protein